ncbi:3-hydroxybutyryl-dehydrogenase [Paraphaeosphaeria sporulosa]
MKHARAKKCSNLPSRNSLSHDNPLHPEGAGERTLPRPALARVAQGHRSRNRQSSPEFLAYQTSTPSGDGGRNQANILASTGSGRTDTEDHLAARPPHLGLPGEALTSWAERIFQYGFETSFGLLLGRYGCPFVDDPNSGLNTPLSELMRRLDVEHRFEEAWIPMATTATGPPAASTSNVIENHSSSPPCRPSSPVEKVLDRAILAFTARWLPLGPGATEPDEIAATSWRSSRSDMVALLNQVSYRSVLSLYLFAQTPVPAGISEEEELSGITGPVCMHTALMHIQKLRQRCDPVKKGLLNITQTFLDLESRAYWAAVMWDTSDAMTSDMRTLLTSGLNGACSEPAWRLSKAFLVGSFGPATEEWCVNGAEVTDERASQIIGAASVCQTLMWKSITSVKEALREGVDEETVLWVWGSLQETMAIFKKSVQPPLSGCERRIHFLSQRNRFGWFQITLQYCIGVMVLVEALQVAKRSDLAQQLHEIRKQVEHDSFAILKFGTDNIYHMPTRGIAESDGDSTPATQSLKLSFIALYAFPHLVVTLAQLLGRVAVRKRHTGEVDSAAFAHLSSMVMDSLEQLPKSSRAARAAIRGLEATVGEAMD